MDISVTVPGEILESDGSLAARRSAERVGAIEGSSYTTRSGRPVAWAFDVAYEALGPARSLIVAGAEHTKTRVYMLVPEERAFSGMLMAKGIVCGTAREDLVPHQVVFPDPDAFGSLDAHERCDDFYVCRALFGAPAPTPGLAAIGLRPEEVGLGADFAVACLRARTPEGLTTLDPRRHEPWYLHFSLLIRRVRRLARLAELGAPQALMENDQSGVARSRAALDASGWTLARAPLPPDVAERLDRA